MELKNKAMIKLLDKIYSYYKELVERPAALFSDEDRLIMQIITDLKSVAEKYVTPKEKEK